MTPTTGSYFVFFCQGAHHFPVSISCSYRNLFHWWHYVYVHDYIASTRLFSHSTYIEDTASRWTVQYAVHSCHGRKVPTPASQLIAVRLPIKSCCTSQRTTAQPPYSNQSTQLTAVVQCNGGPPSSSRTWIGLPTSPKAVNNAMQSRFSHAFYSFFLLLHQTTTVHRHPIIPFPPTGFSGSPISFRQDALLHAPVTPHQATARRVTLPS